MGTISVENSEEVVKRAMYLAWIACGTTAGLGFLQDNPEATEEEVWESISTRKGEASADYVFGRMMKLKLKYTESEINFYTSELTPDYQAWCIKYPTAEELIIAAIEDLK